LGRKERREEIKIKRRAGRERATAPEGELVKASIQFALKLELGTLGLSGLVPFDSVAGELFELLHDGFEFFIGEPVGGSGDIVGQRDGSPRFL